MNEFTVKVGMFSAASSKSFLRVVHYLYVSLYRFIIYMIFMRTGCLTISYRIAFSVTGLPCVQYRDSVVINIRMCNIKPLTPE
jgi:hypothetical protein